MQVFCHAQTDAFFLVLTRIRVLTSQVNRNFEYFVFCLCCYYRRLVNRILKDFVFLAAF